MAKTYRKRVGFQMPTCDHGLDRDGRLAHYREIIAAQEKLIERLQWRAFDLETQLLIERRGMPEGKCA